MTKNSYLAGILSFFLLGLGYLYNGKRLITGVLFTVGAVIATFVEFQLMNSDFNLFLISFAGFFLLAIGAAIDAYQEAESL
jgi:hypothetical protein